MKHARIAAWAVLAIVVLLLLVITFTVGWRPFIGPRARPLTSRTFERTPARLERGKYLVEGVAACLGCHSPHDWTQHDAPILPGMAGAGSDMFGMKGLPGKIIASNLTSDKETGAGDWTDDMLARAIREGVGHDGRALFPMMPYQGYRKLPDEDLASIIVYLRSLPPVRNALPATEVIFPVKYLIRTVPEPLTQPVPAVIPASAADRGAYLMGIAGCADCHTPMEQGQPMPEMNYAGGQIFEGLWGRVASANLTPDPSGIPYYDEQTFIQTIRTGMVQARKLNPIMPWHMFRYMNDDDLKAMFAYMKTLKPVRHSVDNSESPTDCKVCKTSHGGGSRNR